MDFLVILLACVFVLAILGIIISFSPTLIITELAILTKSKKPFIHTVALIAGIASAVIIFCLISMLFVDPTKEIDLPSRKGSITTVPIADILVGVLMTVLAVRIFRKNGTKKTKSAMFNPDKILSAKPLFWFGLIKMATSLSSIAAILYASRFIKTYLDSGQSQFVAVVWLLVISILPFVLIVVIEKFRPDTFKRIHRTSDRVSGLNWKKIIAVCLLTVGVLLIITGLTNLDKSIF